MTPFSPVSPSVWGVHLSWVLPCLGPWEILVKNRPNINNKQTIHHLALPTCLPSCPLPCPPSCQPLCPLCLRGPQQTSSWDPRQKMWNYFLTNLKSPHRWAGSREAMSLAECNTGCCSRGCSKTPEWRDHGSWWSSWPSRFVFILCSWICLLFVLVPAWGGCSSPHRLQW